MAHVLKPESGTGGALSGPRERVAATVAGECEFELRRQIFSFHAENYEGPPTTSDVVGGKKDGKILSGVSYYSTGTCEQKRV